MIVIIGLMSSAVVMTMAGDPPKARSFAAQMNQDLNQAAQQSLLSGEPFALGLSRENYAIMRYEEAGWRADLSRPWGENIDPALSTGGEPKSLTDKLLPHVMFEPTGISQIFELTLRGEDGIYILSSQGSGRVEMRPGS